ncbi:MAG: isopentenyl phosphate kinase [Candidatus Micrarchaeota archaeon]|nr:isopentenyl phosphate kinase [Candidatus Micrarchaeota archaeon]
MAELVVLKLGGSVLTDKKKALTANKKVIARLAKEVGEVINSAQVRVVVVHGAGSFGHILAKKYGLQGGVHDASQRIGFAETHAAVTELSQLIAREFAKNNVPAIPVYPLLTARQQNKKLVSFNHQVVKDLLFAGLTPIVPGDVVLDGALAGSICSGDASAPWLARALEAKRMVFGVDVEGVCTTDPKKDRKAVLIPEITSKNINQVLASLGGSSAPDVTGGMRGKIMELAEQAKATPITIVNALKPGRVRDALLGKQVTGTRVLF